MLAVDIGGSSIKLLVLDEQGEPVSEAVARPTPAPPTPDALFTLMHDMADSLPPHQHVSVGFPGSRQGRGHAECAKPRRRALARRPVERAVGAAPRASRARDQRCRSPRAWSRWRRGRRARADVGHGDGLGALHRRRVGSKPRARASPVSRRADLRRPRARQRAQGHRSGRVDGARSGRDRADRTDLQLRHTAPGRWECPASSSRLSQRTFGFSRWPKRCAAR